MLFMMIYTYEPAQRDEIIKRRAERRGKIPEGARLIGAWSAIGGGRVFRVLELDDPKVALAGTSAWNDLGNVEIVPVMEAEEMEKLMQSQ